MLEILFIIAPVFLIIFAGYVASASSYLPPETSDLINSLSIKLTLPLLLFRAMYDLDFSKAFNFPMLFGFFFSAICSFILCMVLARLFWKRRPGEAVAVGFCAFFTNAVLLGLPISERAFGSEVQTIVYGIIAFHIPIVYPIGMIAMELARRDGASFTVTFKKTIVSIFSNPLMIGLLLGIICNQVGLIVPTPLRISINMIADGALPIAILGIGVALTRYQMKAEFMESLMVSIIALVFYPAMVLFFTYVIFDLPKLYVQAAVSIAAMPAGLNVYIFASLYNRAMGLAASVILTSTLFSILTISLWLQFLRSL